MFAISFVIAAFASCICAYPAAVCEGGSWTQFFDRDYPGGYGDYETLNLVLNENPGKLCKKPTAIEARLSTSNLPYQFAGQVVAISPTYGFHCVNTLNSGKCKNYKVRFCCPSIPKCGEGHAWTQFFDRDNPGGYGDYETLSLLLNENPGKLCKNPTAIDARLVSNNDPYQSANQVVTISTTSGFYCVNSQNSGPCKDYKVRFCCRSIPKCGEGHAWTQFFDRDNPGGYGDYETLSLLLNENPGKLCKNPTAIDARLVSNNDPYQSANQVVTISTSYGFQCVNSQNSGQCEDYEVRFCCPSVQEPTCGRGHAWTQFFDRDNPGGYGDYETLNHLLNENPGKLCKQPTAIDARLVSSKNPYQSANQVVTISTSYGFQCVNSQNSGQCEDYEVRFCCPLKISSLLYAHQRLPGI